MTMMITIRMNERNLGQTDDTRRLGKVIGEDVCLLVGF